MGWTTIFRSRRKQRDSFNEYELRILKEVLLACAPNYSQQLETQVMSMPALMRLDDGLEVRVQERHFPSIDVTGEMRLPLDPHVHILAKVRVHGDVLASNQVSIKLLNGYLYCLDFQSDAAHAQAGAVNALSVQLNPIFAPGNLRSLSEPITIGTEVFYLPK
jgi:hypothetical protein